jgi:hypothetical protein
MRGKFICHPSGIFILFYRGLSVEYNYDDLAFIRNPDERQRLDTYVRGVFLSRIP